jgi:Mrp family chromosome partitioning ATPase
VSKYYDALKRGSNETEDIRLVHPPRTVIATKGQGLTQRSREIAAQTEPLIDKSSSVAISVVEQRSAAQDLPEAMARQDAIRQLCERIAPTATVEKSCRIAVSGCRPRDGASSIATAIAYDLSQRLLVRTLLIDANLQAPGLHRGFSFGERRSAEMLLVGSVQLRPTGWPRLTLATCCLESDELECDLLMAELDPVLCTFPAVVIDLGVPRLDPRMLPLVRPADPIMLVVRYGQTERRELVTTAAALRSANRTVAGLVLNAKPSLMRSSSGENSSI